LATVVGREVLHIFDQSFASSFWIGLLLAFEFRFVLRWKKDYHLVEAASATGEPPGKSLRESGGGKSGPSGIVAASNGSRPATIPVRS